jgi:hypothetical protein
MYVAKGQKVTPARNSMTPSARRLVRRDPIALPRRDADVPKETSMTFVQLNGALRTAVNFVCPAGISSLYFTGMVQSCERTQFEIVLTQSSCS